MSTEFANAPKVVGAKQVRRALEGGRVSRFFIARDADPQLLQPLVQKAVNLRIPVEQVDTMELLGARCGIAVGAAIAALLR